jgi:peptidoglycan/LPS O-acetylase OafA/YrhL
MWRASCASIAARAGITLNWGGLFTRVSGMGARLGDAMLFNWSTIADRSGGRDNNFNLLRMLAAVGVLVSHAYPVTLGPDGPQLLEGWLQGITLGDACVLIFFAISGFFITRSFDGKKDLRAFLLARIVRIFPALAVMLVLTVLIAGLWVTATTDEPFWASGVDYAIRNVLLFLPAPDLPGLFADNPFGPIVNSSLWTLSYEVMCYAWVLVCGVLGLLAAPRPFLIALAVFTLAMGVKVGWEMHPRFETFVYLGLPFVIGMSFYIWRAVIPLSGALGLGLVALAVLSHPTPLFVPVMILAMTYAVFVIGYARLPSLERYNRLGDYSYGTYIYAFPLQQAAVAAGFATPLLNMVVALPLAVICAVLSWRYVEAPALKIRPRPVPSGLS